MFVLVAVLVFGAFALAFWGRVIGLVIGPNGRAAVSRNKYWIVFWVFLAINVLIHLPTA